MSDFGSKADIGTWCVMSALPQKRTLELSREMSFRRLLVYLPVLQRFYRFGRLINQIDGT